MGSRFLLTRMAHACHGVCVDGSTLLAHTHGACLSCRCSCINTYTHSLSRTPAHPRAHMHTHFLLIRLQTRTPAHPWAGAVEECVRSRGAAGDVGEGASAGKGARGDVPL